MNIFSLKWEWKAIINHWNNFDYKQVNIFLNKVISHHFTRWQINKEDLETEQLQFLEDFYLYKAQQR